MNLQLLYDTVRFQIESGAWVEFQATPITVNGGVRMYRQGGE